MHNNHSARTLADCDEGEEGERLLRSGDRDGETVSISRLHRQRGTNVKVLACEGDDFVETSKMDARPEYDAILLVIDVDVAVWSRDS